MGVETQYQCQEGKQKDWVYTMDFCVRTQQISIGVKLLGHVQFPVRLAVQLIGTDETRGDPRMRVLGRIGFLVP